MTDNGLPMDLARLVSDHHEVLYRYAFRLTGSQADAEDLTQQVYLIAYVKLNQLRDPASARSWLYTILRNAYLKSRRAHVPLPASSIELDMNCVSDEIANESLDLEGLQAAMDELSEEFKLVVMLYYFEQRSYREMAEILDIPLGTVMSRLARARSRLRSRLVAADERVATVENTNAVSVPSAERVSALTIRRGRS